MKRKKIDSADDAFEYLIEFISEEIDEQKDKCIYSLNESTEFKRGAIFGAIMMMDDLRTHVRQLLKHGYEHLTIEDWSSND